MNGHQQSKPLVYRSKPFVRLMTTCSKVNKQFTG